MKSIKLDNKQDKILLKLQEILNLHALVIDSNKRIEKLLTQLPLEALGDEFMRLQKGIGRKNQNMVSRYGKTPDKCQKCTITISGEWSFRRSEKNPNFCTDCILKI